MKKVKSAVFVLALACVLMMSAQAMAAIPSVSISGISGAAGWLWVEAEDATLYQGGPGFSYNSDLSGYRDIPTFPNNYIQQEWRQGPPSITWDLNIPTAMSSAAKILVHGGSHYGTGVDVQVDGATVSNIASLPIGSWGYPSGWVSANLAAMSAGSHSVAMVDAGGYEIYGWDGILIYDGDISVAGHPTTIGWQQGRTWFSGANMQPNSKPVIADPVAISFAVDNEVNVTYWINKDGVESAYIPGTTISSPGDYRVWAEAWGSYMVDGDVNIPQQRIIAGVDFEMQAVPEPGSMFALAAGLVGLVGLRRRK